MYIIGISAFYHDSAACLMKNGEIIFAASEERFSRIKNDSSFPILAINAMFERKTVKYIAINTGYWVVTLALMGGILCQWV